MTDKFQYSLKFHILTGVLWPIFLTEREVTESLGLYSLQFVVSGSMDA